MTEDEWGALVGRLEVKASENPKAYGRRVLLLGALGYFVIGLALAVLVGLSAVVLWFVVTGHALLIKLIWPLAAVGYVIVRALSVRIDPPDGIPIPRAEAPVLFEMIDDVVKRVEGPRIHHVLLSADLNAFVAQIPRGFGIFGWTNYMVLGVPYMQALEADEFRAVVAHEVGHLSRTHGRAGTRIYRVQATWQQLLVALEARRSWIGGLFRGFFEWYAPYFAAYSFPLRRRHEYEADEAAADAAGARPAATALLRAVLAGSYLERTYWPHLFTRINDEAEPPEYAFAGIGPALADATKSVGTAAVLKAHLDATPAPYDTHPTIRQRVEHLGLDVDELARETALNGHATRPTAAEVYLGVAEANVLTQLDRDWREAVAPHWREQHLQAQEAKARLEELEGAESEGLTRDERVERAHLATIFRSEAERIGLLRDLVQENDDAYLRYLLGRAMLSSGDERGLAELERAMELDVQAVPDSTDAAWEFLSGLGRLDEAESYRARAVATSGELEAAVSERNHFELDGPFAPHRLTPAALERLRDKLEAAPKVRRAYVVRRRMEHLDEELPAHVLFLEAVRSGLDIEMVSEIDFDGWVAPLDGSISVAEDLDPIPGSKIFER